MTAYSFNYLEDAFDKIYLLRNNYNEDVGKMKEFIKNIDEFSIVANSFIESLDFQKSFNDIKILMKTPLSDKTTKLITQLIEITMIKIKKLTRPESNINLQLHSAFTSKSPLVFRRIKNEYL